MSSSEPKKCICQCHMTGMITGQQTGYSIKLCCSCRDKPGTESSCDKDSTKCMCLCHTELKPVCCVCCDCGTETLSLCPHGVPFKFNSCNICNPPILTTSIDKELNEIFKRLDKLEECGYVDWKSELVLFKNQRNELLERLAKLEKQMKELSEECNSTNRALSATKFMDRPHRCPVCEGTRKHPDQSPRVGKVFPDTDIYVCEVCDGKGVLWN